jgi:hypothetical protein
MDKELGRITPQPPSVIPGSNKLGWEHSNVPWLSATPALLGIRSFPIEGMLVAVYPDVGGSVGCVGVRFPDDGLALSVAPRGRDDDGGGLEEDSAVGGLVEHVGAFVEEFLKGN